jgi:hypothetical protein
MSVINCKVKYIRPKYKNLKEWIKDDNNAYIGRYGVVFIKNDELNKLERYPKESSIWANPFKINKETTRQQVLDKYKEYITNKLNENPKLITELLKLKGKKLGCWCYPEPCHGNILLELIDKYTINT